MQQLVIIKIKKIIDLFAQAGIIVFALLFPLFAAAESISTTQANNYTFKQLGWDIANTLNGYQPELTFYVPLGKPAEVQKARMHLILTFSPVLTDGTQVLIRFNQQLVGTLTLPVTESRTVSADIDLPLTQLSANWQQLSFSAYLKSDKSLCDPNIWVYVSPNSTISLDTSPRPFAGFLNELPYPFIDATAIDPPSTMLLIPQNPAVSEVLSALHVAMTLGQHASEGKIAFSTALKEDAPEKQQASNLILVGNAEKVLSKSQSLSLNEALLRKDGVLVLTQSPHNPYRALLTITGADDQALEKATIAFLPPELPFLASGSIAYINQMLIQDDIEPIGDFYQTTFNQMGFSDNSVSGMGRHVLSYDIPLPNDRIPQFSKVTTLITAPLLGDKGHSQITLVMNGKKQSSLVLTQEHTSWKVGIETSAMKPGLNRLQYYLHLNPQGNGYESCMRSFYDEVWATIYAQSQFETSFFNKFPLAMLNQLPVPFDVELTAVVPATYTQQDLQQMPLLFFKLGQIFDPKAIKFTIRSSNEIDESFIRDHNVLILGTPMTNPWVQFALDYMPVSLQRNSRFINIPKKKMQVTGDNATGLLELLPSPWSQNSAVLLVAGDNDKGLINAIKVFVDDTKRLNMNGNIAFVNSDLSVESFNSYQNSYVSTKQRFMISLRNQFKNIYYYVSNHPEFIIYLLAFLIPLIVVLRNRKK